MGWNAELFVEVNQNLICSICKNVFYKPVMTVYCKHVFCYPCIHDWMWEADSCPLCREGIRGEIRGVPDLDNLLRQQKIKCFNHTRGCTVELTLNTILEHQKACALFNVDDFIGIYLKETRVPSSTRWQRALRKLQKEMGPN
jgi:hypothetical protein